MWVAVIFSLAFSSSFQLLGALFQYTDNQGNQHIVSDAELVPPRFRRNVQILDDDGQVLGELEENTGSGAQDRQRLEELKARGRGQKKSKKKSSQRLLEELLAEEEDDEAGLDATGKRSNRKPASPSSRPTPDQPFAPPTGSPGWMLLAIGIIFIVFALRVLQGFLKILAFACGVMALLMFVSEEYGDTPVGAKVKVATEGLVKPIKQVQKAAGDNVASPLKAPYEVIQKVRGAVEGHKEAAEERNAILDQLTEGD